AVSRGSTAALAHTWWHRAHSGPHAPRATHPRGHHARGSSAEAATSATLTAAAEGLPTTATASHSAHARAALATARHHGATHPGRATTTRRAGAATAIAAGDQAADNALIEEGRLGVRLEQHDAADFVDHRPAICLWGRLALGRGAGCVPRRCG